MPKVKARTMNLVLYPESQQSAIDSIIRNCCYVGILHDRDTDVNGLLKKPHYHFIVRFKQARWSSAFAKELGIEDHIESTLSFERSVRYLVHMDNPEKYQYSQNDLICSEELRPSVAKCLSEFVCEELCVKAILDLIESYPYPISYSYVLHRVLELGLYGEFRRMGFLAGELIREHNAALGVQNA